MTTLALAGCSVAGNQAANQSSPTPSAPPASATVNAEALPEIKKAEVEDVDAAILALSDEDIESYYNVLCELSTFPQVADIRRTPDLSHQDQVAAIERINDAPPVIRLLGYQNPRVFLEESSVTSPYPQVPDRCFENGRTPTSLDGVTPTKSYNQN